MFKKTLSLLSLALLASASSTVFAQNVGLGVGVGGGANAGSTGIGANLGAGANAHANSHTDAGTASAPRAASGTEAGATGNAGASHHARVPAVIEAGVSSQANGKNELPRSNVSNSINGAANTTLDHGLHIAESARVKGKATAATVDGNVASANKAVVTKVSETRQAVPKATARLKAQADAKTNANTDANVDAKTSARAKVRADAATNMKAASGN